MSVQDAPAPTGPPDGTDLLALARGVLDGARTGEQVEVVVGRSTSTTVKVYGGEVESLTSAGSSGAGVRVIRDGRQGFAHCGSLDPDALAETLAEARDNAAFGQPDEFNGVAEPDGVAAVPQDTWSDAVVDLDPVRKVDLALELERRVLGLDPRVTTARSTAFGDGWGETAIVSTSGIEATHRGASCSVSTQPMARDGDETQIGWSYDAGRDPGALDLDRVAAEAVERATRLLGATKPPSGRMTILLEPRLAATLLGVVAGMFSGEAVLKGRSPFADRVGEQIASPLLHLVDDPTRSESLGAEEVDGEGLACRPNPLIEDGVLRGFLQNSYTGRRSGSASTGSAVRGVRSLPGVGAQVLVMAPGTRSFDELTASIDHGLYVTSFAGLHSGVNPVSGDFSVGADGLLISGGQLGAPVREMTVASTLQRLLLDIVEVGGDFEWLPGGDGACSLVIGDVSISGA
jgi:PmbA protein